MSKDEPKVEAKAMSVKVELSLGARLIVSHLVYNLTQGVDRAEARMVRAASDDLKLGELPVGVVDSKNATAATEFEMTELMVDWLAEKLNKAFDARQITPQQSPYALALAEAMDAAKNEFAKEKTGT
jgi:hypothetical protein